MTAPVVDLASSSFSQRQLPVTQEGNLSEGGPQIRLACGSVCGGFSGLLAGAGGTKSVDGGIITSPSLFSWCELNGYVDVIRQLGESAMGWEAYKQ